MQASIHFSLSNHATILICMTEHLLSNKIKSLCVLLLTPCTLEADHVCGMQYYLLNISKLHEDSEKQTLIKQINISSIMSVKQY